MVPGHFDEGTIIAINSCSENSENEAPKRINSVMSVEQKLRIIFAEQKTREHD